MKNYLSKENIKLCIKSLAGRKRNKEYKILYADLNLQNGYTEKEFWDFLIQYALSDADERTRDELKNYLKEDFRRFCYTFSLLPDIDQKYKVFEIGGNPYYLTALMKNYTNYQVKCSNFFDSSDNRFYEDEQKLVSRSGEKSILMPYVNLNIERNWSEEGLDLLCFCEVFEHMIESPLKALLNINKMLKADGYLIMTTPNVNRLENIAKMISGANIYDLYSGYGLYGRHNREYNKHELWQLLTLCGFEIEVMFSSNVHAEYAVNYFSVNEIMKLISSIQNRNLDLGQYIFIRAKKIKNVEKVEAPDWLYRSMNDRYITVGKKA